MIEKSQDERSVVNISCKHITANVYGKVSYRFLCHTVQCQPLSFFRRNRVTIFILSILWLLSWPLSSQTPVASAPLDTINYQYYHTEDIYTLYPSDDTLLDSRYLQKVVLWDENQHYVNSGNYGASLWPLIFRPETFMGFNVGIHNYNIYQVRPEKFKYYAPNAPVSDLFFSQLGTQNNLMVGADFSRGFTNGISMSLNYKRLSYAGQYLGADTKSTGFGIAFRYESPNKRHNTIFLFTQNANEEGHNGGVVNDSLVRDNPFRRSVPTRLREATSRQQEQSFIWHQYFKLTQKNQSSSNFYLLNTVKYQPSYYNYSDREVDSTQHAQFYKWADFDSRGMRRYLDISHWSEGFFIHAEKKQSISGRIGLTYDNFTITDGLKRTLRNDLTASFDGYIPIFKTLFLNTKARLGLLENIGNFNVSGQLDIKLSDWLVLTGQLELFRSEPSYIAQNLTVNDTQEISNDFNKPFGSVISAQFFIPKINLKVGLTQSLIDQMIYFDVNGTPQQSNALFNMSLLYASHKLEWGILGFDNQVYLQTQPNRLFPVPDLFSSHQLYFKGRWFKKVMDVNIGLDARIINAYNGPAFQPLFMNFHLSDERLSNVPAVHAFFMAKVSRFRALLMMDNISQYFIPETNYHVVGHPQLDPLFRLSLRWLLLD